MSISKTKVWGDDVIRFFVLRQFSDYYNLFIYTFTKNVLNLIYEDVKNKKIEKKSELWRFSMIKKYVKAYIYKYIFDD